METISTTGNFYDNMHPIPLVHENKKNPWKKTMTKLATYCILVFWEMPLAACVLVLARARHYHCPWHAVIASLVVQKTSFCLSSSLQAHHPQSLLLLLLHHRWWTHHRTQLAAVLLYETSVLQQLVMTLTTNSLCTTSMQSTGPHNFHHGHIKVSGGPKLHSISRWTRGVQVKLTSLENACHTWAPRGVFMTRCYTNSCLPYLTFTGVLHSFPLLLSSTPTGSPWVSLLENVWYCQCP